MKKRIILLLILLFAAASAFAQTLTLPAGLYRVGESFPEGRWTVTAFNPELLPQLYRLDAPGEFDPAAAEAIALAEPDIEAEIYEPIPGEYLFIQYGDAVFAPADEESARMLEDFLASGPDIPILSYIGNRNTKKFHFLHCSSITQMKDKNKAALYSREDVDAGSYVACKNCNP